ncbi:MAG: sulfatase, partial [Mucilaginibacter sp.]|nr:sulfatase [Mucilaginibacter sp.]
IPVNQVRTQVATNIDWFPTLAAYCSIKLPARKLDGQSLLPVINSEQSKTPHPMFHWQSQGGKNNPQWSVLDGDWKLMHSPFEAKKDELNSQNYFLANLKDDPSEQHNVADKHPEIVQRLEAAHNQWLGEVFTQ